MNIHKSAAILFAAAGVLIVLRAPARAQKSQSSQEQQQHQDSMPGMDMSRMRHDSGADPDASQSAHEAMSGHDMNMNAHMFMTALRPENPGDEKRAAEILAALRPAIEKYEDYHVALADGFQIFLPNLPQTHYHFTNHRYAFEAEFVFNPAHPTSLLYKKTANGYELEGAMYTAPKKAAEDDLNERVPLSVARWHKHVNLCLPPKGAQMRQANWQEFGLRGTIATQDACEAAGGRWIPQIFNWMVHVYPYETDPQKIWAH
jgi:hypothetical protein